MIAWEGISNILIVRYAYYIVDSDEKMSDFSIPSSIDEPEVGIKAPY